MNYAFLHRLYLCEDGVTPETQNGDTAPSELTLTDTPDICQDEGGVECTSTPSNDFPTEPPAERVENEENQENGENGENEEETPDIEGATYAPEDAIPTLGDGEPLLSIRHLDKAYKRGEYVLNDFSLDITSGQIVGLLGPNGCGKTTLLKMICGLLVPDGGMIEIAGEEQSELTNRYISYLPERTYFTPGMKVSSLLDYFADFYEDFNRSLAEDMLVELDIPLDARLRALSKGMKEKVQLVLVMSRKTKLYLLDEPIGGVDPAAREYVLGTILARYNTDASVIITTHLISDVEPILNSFAFLGYRGEILAYGQAEDAREETGKSLDELFREVFRCYRKL